MRRRRPTTHCPRLFLLRAAAAATLLPSQVPDQGVQRPAQLLQPRHPVIHHLDQVHLRRRPTAHAVRRRRRRPCLLRGGGGGERRRGGMAEEVVAADGVRVLGAAQRAPEQRRQVGVQPEVRVQRGKGRQLRLGGGRRREGVGEQRRRGRWGGAGMVLLVVVLPQRGAGLLLRLRLGSRGQERHGVALPLGCTGGRVGAAGAGGCWGSHLGGRGGGNGGGAALLRCLGPVELVLEVARRLVQVALCMGSRARGAFWNLMMRRTWEACTQHGGPGRAPTRAGFPLLAHTRALL